MEPRTGGISAGCERSAKFFTMLVAVKPREILGIRFAGFDFEIDKDRPVFL